MTKNNKKTQNHINIEISEEVAEGQYSNLVIVSHSKSEFILDFVRLLPGLPQAKVKSRIIMTPDHAYRLMNALQDNIDTYENNFGEINQNDDSNQFNFSGENYQGPIGEA